MEKSFFSTLWKQKSGEWLSKAISDTANLHNVDTDFINSEIETFFMKFSTPDRSESEWYNEYIAINESLKANFDKVAAESKITSEKASFLPISLKYSLGLLIGIIVTVIAKCLGVTIFRPLLIGAFAGIIVYYFAGNFQNRANKRKAKTLTDNVKRQLDEIYTKLKKECDVD